VQVPQARSFASDIMGLWGALTKVTIYDESDSEANSKAGPRGP